MSSNTKRYLPLALLVCAVAGPAAAQAPVADLRSPDDSIARLERMLEARNQMQIDMQRQLDQMAGEIDSLRGTVEKNSYDIGQMLERQRDLYREVDTLRTAKPAVTPEPKTNEPEGGVIASNRNENEEYQKAVDLILKKKDYSGAISAFNAFLGTYPQSVYTPNAHYWLGQLYFSQSKLEDAKKNFAAVENYKDSNKRADAMLKLGLISEREGDKAGAKKIFQDVVSKFPGTTSAQQAQNRLK